MEKESDKWLLVAERTQRGLRPVRVECVTAVGERESDIYAAWDRIPEVQTHLLVRTCRDRRLQGITSMLYEPLSQQSNKW